MNLINNSVIQGAFFAPCIAVKLSTPIINFLIMAGIILCLLLTLLLKKEYIYENAFKLVNPVIETIKRIIPNFIYAVIITLVIALTFGYRPLIVTSGSMRPSIEPGAVILVKLVDLDELKVGDVITFSRGGAYTTHQIVALKTDGSTFQLGEVVECNLNGEKFTITIQSSSVGGQIITHGTGNSLGNYDTAIKYENVKGKVFYCVWYVGLILYTLRKQILSLVIVLLTIFVGYKYLLHLPSYSIKD